jgi:signal transduction histidine kinase
MKKQGIWIVMAAVLAVLFLFNLAAGEEAKYEEKRSLVKNLVDEAVALIQEKGAEALPVIADKNGKFCTKDTYVFVTSGETGADLINPEFQEVEGMPPENYTDPDTKQAQMIIVDAVKDKDEAWVEYLWPKPGEEKVSKKIAYLKKIIINSKVRIVGAGFYPQE